MRYGWIGGWLGALGVVVGAGHVLGQVTMEAPLGRDVPYMLDTGVLDNPTDGYVLAYVGEIQADGADWLRVFFAYAALGRDSVLYVTSLSDGGMQVLDAVSLGQWSNSTAYFNGDRVLLELYAGPHTRGNRLVVDRLSVSDALGGAAGSCGVCDGDDRVLSDEKWVGRSMPIGCTSAMYSPTGCLLTAGHCINGTGVMQFNVPPSLPNGQIQNPPPQDQYPVDQSSKQSVNAGVGADWAHFWCFPNSITGLLPIEAQGEYRPIGSIPTGLPVPIEVYGYGVASVGVMNQSQKFSPGFLLSVNAPGQNICSLNHTADTTGGNSGSPVLYNDKIIGIASHCLCPNIATCISLPQLLAATESCPPDVRGDCNGDLDIDLMDYARLQNCFGQSGTGDCVCADVTENGTVDKIDAKLYALIMKGPTCVPAASQALVSQPVCAGDYVALQTAAVGSFEKSFTWYHDGAELPGEEAATLLIPTFKPEDVGTYRVEVINACGFWPSNTAQLTLCSALLFADNFEEDLGWTVVSPPEMKRGKWDRSPPNLVMLGDEVTQPGEDNPNGVGVRCYVTGSSGGAPQFNDVDGGPTELFSPIINAGGHAAVYLRFAYWFFRDNDDGDDALILRVSSDGGATFTTIREYRTNTKMWREEHIKLTGLVPVTGHMQILFSIEDKEGDTILEAAVDDVRIIAVD